MVWKCEGGVMQRRASCSHAVVFSDVHDSPVRLISCIQRDKNACCFQENYDLLSHLILIATTVVALFLFCINFSCKIRVFFSYGENHHMQETLVISILVTIKNCKTIWADAHQTARHDPVQYCYMHFSKSIHTSHANSSLYIDMH